MNYSSYALKSPSEREACFFDHLSPTNRTPEYYVNWKKVVKNTRELEISLNTLNFLVGKSDIFFEAKRLFIQQPDLLKAIPALLASRDKNFNVLSFDDFDNMQFSEIDFYNIDIAKIDEYLEFIEQSGLLNFLQNNAVKSLVDYVLGVEVGLDSNGRKNRSGTTMEGIVERYVEKVCQILDLEFHIQATSEWMEKNWGIYVPVDKSIRRFDVAVYDRVKHKVYVIETNYYGGGGSKLKSVCGEFVTLNQLINRAVEDVNFIWITDGLGWKTARIPLSEAFFVIDNIFNLKMLQEDFLLELFSK